MKLTISGYSTALFSTWYFIEELGLLFDAGDGLVSTLMQKSRKINNVFISHADRDHLTGLLQFNQLNARKDAPVIFYPKDSGSFPALEDFAKKFDPHVAGTLWKPMAAGDVVAIKNDIQVESLANGHVVTKAGLTKSLSYKVVQTKRKLKPELRHLSGEEIRALTDSNGKDSVSTEERTTILGYSGDTPVEDLSRWQSCSILIHEATFLGGKEESPIQTHGNLHSRLEEVIAMVSGSNIEKLILGHFSSRYSAEQIDRSIRELCEKYALKTSVWRVLPGEAEKDMLSQKPLNG